MSVIKNFSLLILESYSTSDQKGNVHKCITCAKLLAPYPVYAYNDNTNMEAIHITKLVKSGDSMGVIIPKNIRTAYGWERGDILVFVFASDTALTIRRLTPEEIRAIKDKERVIDYKSNREIHGVS